MKKKEKIALVFDGRVWTFWESVYLFYGVWDENEFDFFYYGKDSSIASLTTNPYDL